MKKAPDVSIIIPSRNEEFLDKTVRDVLEKAEGSVEVIVTLDGYWPQPQLIADPRVVLIHRGKPMGMRAGINAGVATAKGKYILKCDAHCMFMKGFDKVLPAYCGENWVVIPRRKRLDAENWKIQDVGKPDVDYEYLSYPNKNGDWETGLHGKIWNKRIQERKNISIDDNMSAQGSCWFMHKDYFHALELEDEQNYGTFSNEFQEIGLKCWLSGGRVVTNKKVWYAHYHKTRGRGYSLDREQLKKGKAYTNRWITNTAWHKQTLPFTWLIEKFWPVPEWPEDREQWTPIKKEKNKMVIHVYSIVRDEEDMLPYFLRHYSKFADKIFIIDDHSRDDTIKIAKANKKVHLLKYNFAEGFIEEEHNDCFEKYYKKYSRGVADWVMVVDADEFICHHGSLLEVLKTQQKLGRKVIKTAGYTMYSQIFPTTKGQIYEECKYGLRSRLYDKAVIFNPSVDISFHHGRHKTTTPPGVFQHRAKVLLLHYRYISLVSSIKPFVKIKIYRERKLLKNIKIALDRYQQGVLALKKGQLLKVI